MENPRSILMESLDYRIRAIDRALGAKRALIAHYQNTDKAKEWKFAVTNVLKREIKELERLKHELCQY